MAVDRSPRDFMECLDRFFEDHFLPRVAEKYPNNCPMLVDVLRGVKQEAAESYFAGGSSPASHGTPSLKLPVEGATGSGILFSLELTHDCAATGCGEPACLLCERNPSRKCDGDFMSDKYIEHGGLLSMCGQPMKIVLKDRRTGEIFHQDMELVVSLLKGHEFSPHLTDGGFHCATDFRPYMDMFKSDGQPLLDSKSTTSQRKQDDGIHFRMQGGIATFPADLTTTTSSSSHHGCKNGSFRLLVRTSSDKRGFPAPHQIQAFVSKQFATVTSRARPLLKAKIPFLTDDVEKLDRMGKERAKKFEHLSDYVSDAGLIRSVSTVAEFQVCAKYANQHGHIRKQIIHAMKLSEVDWTRMVSHASKAVEYDNRVRYFRPREQAGTIQMIIYKCHCAVIDFATGPIGLMQGKKFVPKKEWAWQYDSIAELNRMAINAWAQPNHPYWGILPFDSQEFEKDPSKIPDFNEADSLSADIMSISLEGSDAINVANLGTRTVSPYQDPAFHHLVTARLPRDQHPRTSSNLAKKSIADLGLPIRQIEDDQDILPSPRTVIPGLQPPPLLFPPVASTPPATTSNGFLDTMPLGQSPMTQAQSPIDPPYRVPEPPLAVKPPPSPFTFDEAVKRKITSRPGSLISGMPTGSMGSLLGTTQSEPTPGMHVGMQNGEHASIQIRQPQIHMHVKDTSEFIHAQPREDANGNGCQGQSLAQLSGCPTEDISGTSSQGPPHFGHPHATDDVTGTGSHFGDGTVPQGPTFVHPHPTGDINGTGPQGPIFGDVAVSQGPHFGDVAVSQGPTFVHPHPTGDINGTGPQGPHFGDVAVSQGPTFVHPHPTGDVNGTGPQGPHFGDGTGCQGSTFGHLHERPTGDVNGTGPQGPQFTHLPATSEFWPDPYGLRLGLRTGSEGLCGVRPNGVSMSMSTSDSFLKQWLMSDPTKLCGMVNGGPDGCVPGPDFSFADECIQAVQFLENGERIPPT